MRGAVQGVGFRPFAYGLAKKFDVAGFVRNDAEGVLIEVEGARAKQFAEVLGMAPPPLARIDAIEIAECEPRGETRFEIETTRARRGSERASAPTPPFAQNVSTSCLIPRAASTDTRSSTARIAGRATRSRGPCPTIGRRRRWRRFRCARTCARDYADPSNRRFHAEPIACPRCGPDIDARGRRDIAAAIASGGIVALKGLGGFHLICDARNEEAVARLRKRKRREAKPFAVMVLNVASAERLAEIDEAERALLVSRAAPIVLMKAKPAADLDSHALGPDTSGVIPAKAGIQCVMPGPQKQAEKKLKPQSPTTLDPRFRGDDNFLSARLGVTMRSSPPDPAPMAGVAPRLAEIGLMLPYTPLHWLIFHALMGSPAGADWRDAVCDIALVATSANLGGEPLIADNDEAREKLADVADLIVSHARKIVARADDSVLRVVDGAPAYLRRARGFVPDPIDLGEDGPSVLAHGADLKNTVTITRGREAFVSQYIGDLDDRATMRFRAETIARLVSLIGAKPEIIACDLHPDFLSTRSAEESGLPVVKVQHHVAHVAATAAERGWREGVLGVALDGQGYGADGAPWGGELLTLDGAEWRRVGSLSPLALPGGDIAAREPWRMGVAMLAQARQG